MTRKQCNHRPQANPRHRELNTAQTTDSYTATVRLHFNEMFRVISPDVSDLTPDGVRACVRACVCVCVCVCVCEFPSTA